MNTNVGLEFTATRLHCNISHNITNLCFLLPFHYTTKTYNQCAKSNEMILDVSSCAGLPTISCGTYSTVGVLACQPHLAVHKVQLVCRLANHILRYTEHSWCAGLPNTPCHSYRDIPAGITRCMWTVWL